jgi:ABC-type transporter Mla MlaB component
MATAFKQQPDESTGFTAFTGRLTFKEGCRFWREQRPEEWPFKVCHVDLSGVTGCSDNGLAWLHIFMRWARSVDVEICFVNAPAALRPMLIEAGIPLYRLDAGALTAD